MTGSARLAAINFSSRFGGASITAVEALRGGGGWPSALHQFGPGQALGTVRLTEASLFS
jgi:hypothetical protein